jgi:hypothetical protein
MNCANGFNGLLWGSLLILLWVGAATAQFLRPVIRASDCTPYIRTEHICQDLDDGKVYRGTGSTIAEIGSGAGGGVDTEGSQDAVGAMLLDTATIDLVYKDNTPSLEAHVKDASVTWAKIQDIASDRLVCRDTTGTGSPEACTVGGGIEFTGAGGLQRSALTGDITCAAGSTTCTVATDAVDNTKVANMPAWSFKARNQAGTGDPTDIDLATMAEETAPAPGDFLVGLIDTGEIRRYNIGNLPTLTYKLTDCREDPLTITTPAPWLCLETESSRVYFWDGVDMQPLAFDAPMFGLNAVMAGGRDYTGAQSFETALKVCDGNNADCTGRAGFALYVRPDGPVLEPFDTAGARTASHWSIPDGLSASIRIGNNAGSEYNCITYTADGVATYSSEESCRPRSSGQTTIRATDGTQCSAVEAVEIRSGNGAHSVVRCADNDNGFLYLTTIDPPDNWVPGSLASLTVWVVSDNATPSGTVVLEPSVHCRRPDTDTLVTSWTAGSTASVTLDTQYETEKVEWTNLTVNGTCTSTSVLEARIRFEADSTANGLGTTGDVFVLADTIGISVFLGTNR